MTQIFVIFKFYKSDETAKSQLKSECRIKT